MHLDVAKWFSLEIPSSQCNVVLFSVIPTRLFYVEITSHLFPQSLLLLCESVCEYVHDFICNVYVLANLDILLKWPFQIQCRDRYVLKNSYVLYQSAFPYCFHFHFSNLTLRPLEDNNRAVSWNEHTALLFTSFHSFTFLTSQLTVC